MQQSSATPKNQRCRDWVAEDSCILSILLAVPSCIYSFWHGVIPISYLDFYTCFTNFLCRLNLECNKYRAATYVRACVLCTRIATEVVTCTCNKR